MSTLANMLGLDLGNLVSQAVNESVAETFGRLLVEDERFEQERVSSELENLKSSSSKRDVDEADDEEEVITVAKKAGSEEVDIDVEETEPQVLSPEELQQVTVEDFVDQLNRFRSGQSLKRKDVHQQLSDYWENLTNPEKKAVFAYVQGISQIVTSDVPGADAPDPSSYKIRTGDVELKISAKEKRIKSRPDQDAVSKGKSDELIPIVVGERADKRRELKQLRLLAGK